MIAQSLPPARLSKPVFDEPSTPYEALQLIRYLTAEWMQPKFACGGMPASSLVYIESIYKIADKVLDK